MVEAIAGWKKLAYSILSPETQSARVGMVWNDFTNFFRVKTKPSYKARTLNSAFLFNFL